MKLALAKSLLKSFYKSFVKIGFTYLLESVEKWTLKNTIQFIKKYIKSYPITIILFFIMTVIHLLAYMIGNGPSDHETARKLGALLSVNKDVSEYPYLLTSIYQHIGGMKHYFGNMVGLLIFAPFLEKAYGAIKFTLLFHFTGIIGACCQLYLTSHSISSGASGEKAHALLNEILIGNLTINEYLVSYIETNDINIKIKLLQEFKKTYQKMDEFVIEFKPLYEKVN